ncbi:VRR-NUC domain-containing protein [Pseudomonas sp. HR96]|uniref:VRR-NUC domain-containing protein n=1 Tax=Pseudomonas sp. HR96 TaxID=1027966 RepID=UPI002A74B68D|nr:VRR-NUC domain-containing protein [Pseudomonas sp. HR96]WPP02080.1 VRR-NUC domain-containing protein [Pseudomonas sp. HR96]
MNIDAFDDPFYYLANFRRVLAWLAQRYADLLDAEEQAFIAGFEQAPQASQALLVRMVMRKGEHFRESALAYAEIGCPRQAAQALLAAGWLQGQAPMSLAELFDVLRKAELLSCFTEQFARLGARAALRKAQLYDALSEWHEQQQPFAQWCPQHPEQVYSLQVRALCDRLRLMFFGNLRQGWSEFVLADLGVFRYESVSLDSASRALRHRHDLQQYLALHACRQALEQGADLHHSGRAIAALDSDNPWLLARRDKALFQIGQLHEKQQDWPAALQVYEQCTWPGARLRRIRVLERSGADALALALADSASAAIENAAEAQALQRIVPRLRRRLQLPVPARARAASVARLDLTLLLDATPASVEVRVRDHLHQDQAPVHYVENTLINSLFGLLCWPAIFAAVPGAFFHPFQSGPADLHQPDFHSRRAALFDACLGQLDDERWKASIRTCYAQKWGLQSPFVYWGALTPTLLEQALACLPAQHLRHCFVRLLEDIRHNRAGMPDLIQFWPEEGRYRMIEVKGPGDRLQDNQLRWLEFCALHQMPVEVCYVQYTVQYTGGAGAAECA